MLVALDAFPVLGVGGAVLHPFEGYKFNTAANLVTGDLRKGPQKSAVQDPSGAYVPVKVYTDTPKESKERQATHWTPLRQISTSVWPLCVVVAVLWSILVASGPRGTSKVTCSYT
jgi:hypothetical protein